MSSLQCTGVLLFFPDALGDNSVRVPISVILSFVPKERSGAVIHANSGLGQCATCHQKSPGKFQKVRFMTCPW